MSSSGSESPPVIEPPANHFDGLSSDARFDALMRPHLDSSTVATTVALSVASLSTVAVINQHLEHFDPQYEVAGVAVVAFAANLLMGKLAHYSARRAFEHVDTIERHYLQPIDPARGVRTIRWYGFDSGYHQGGAELSGNVAEFKQISQQVIASNREALAVSASGLESVLRAADIEGLAGAKRNGKRFVYKRIVDYHADDEVTVLSKRDLSELISKFDRQPADPPYRQWALQLARLTSDHPALKLTESALTIDDLRSVRDILKRKIETDSSSGYRRFVLDTTTGKTTNTRITSEAVLTSTTLEHYELSESPYQQTRREFTGKQRLGDAHDEELSLALLTSRIDVGSRPVKEIELSLWQSLTAELASPRHSTPRPVLPTVQSLHHRVQVERPWKAPFLHAAPKPSETYSEPSLEYRGSAARLGKVATSLVLVGGVLFGGLTAADKLGYLHDRTTSSASANITNAIGDANNSNSVIWHLNSTNGADSSGYWPLEVDNKLFVYPGIVSTPPLRNLTLEFQDMPDKYDLLTSLPPRPLSSLPKGLPLIKVTGHFSDKNVPEYQYLGYDATDKTQLSGYRLPVIEGGIPVAPSISVNGHSTDLSIYETPNNTYGFVPSKEYTQGPVDFTYYVIPPQGLTKAADYPAANGYVDVTSSSQNESLPQVISEPVASGLQRKLKRSDVLPANPNPYQLADAISRSHNYSYTPYKSDHDKATVNAAHLTLTQVLDDVVATSATLPDANCNVAMTQELVMLRGQDQQAAPVEPVVGFMQNTNKSNLESSDAHTWLADSNGNRFDPTPSTVAKTKPPVSKTDLAFGLGGIATLLGSAYVGENLLRRRKRHLHAALFPTEPAALEAVASNVHALEWLTYGPPDGTYKAPLEPRTSDLEQKLPNKYHRLLPPKQLKSQINRLPKEQRKEVSQFIAKLQSYKRLYLVKA